MSQSINPTY